MRLELALLLVAPPNYYCKQARNMYIYITPATSHHKLSSRPKAATKKKKKKKKKAGNSNIIPHAAYASQRAGVMYVIIHIRTSIHLSIYKESVTAS